ncbi:IclR family transcriptional regulator C-terminal domain-containing protein [Roseitalea sp. MMSF_3516]|nr:IclR family transcriptional regulator C-terminal domain-containing protein [Roseitalea sp. MMSF_3516]
MTLIAGRPDGISVPEIVDALAVPRSNAVRIVNTLLEYGLIKRGNGRRLVPTQNFHDLCMPDRYGHLRQKYRTALAYIAGELNELVLLGLQEGQGIIHIDYIESDHQIRVAPAPVTRHDLRRNAIGKLALSRRTDLVEEIDDPAFVNELMRIRRTGVAWNREETTPGMIAMACPGFSNRPTEPIIAVAWPTVRFSEEAARTALETIDQARKRFAGRRGSAKT